MLGKLPVPGRLTNLDESKTRVFFLSLQWVRVGVIWKFILSSIISLFFLPLLETARYRLKYCLKGPLNPKQPTNQPIVPCHRHVFSIPCGIECSCQKTSYALKIL